MTDTEPGPADAAPPGVGGQADGHAQLLAEAIDVLTRAARLTRPVLTQDEAASAAAGTPVWVESGKRERAYDDAEQELARRYDAIGIPSASGVPGDPEFEAAVARLEPDLGRELGVPAVKVTGILADHVRARAAGERAAAGRLPVNRSRAARQLAQRLTAAAGVPVNIRWDSSGASSGHGGGWAYHVDWSDGPTRPGMRQLVDQLVDRAAGDSAGDGADPVAGLDPAELVYVRTVQPAAVAQVMVGTVTAGRPALGAHRHVYALEQALEDVEHPERGTDEALQLAAKLGRLSGWNTDRMAELLDAHGLAALTGQLDPDPDGTVVPLARPAGQDRRTR